MADEKPVEGNTSEIVMNGDYKGVNDQNTPEPEKEPGKLAVETITPGARQEIENAHTLAIAKSMGYQTKEEMGDKAKGRTFLDPLTYIKNAQEVTRTKGDTIDILEKKIDNLESIVVDQNIHRDKLVKARVERRLEELKADKERAITDGDIAGVEKVEKEMTDLTDEIPPETKPKNVSDEKKTLAAWEVKNPWFNDDPELRVMAQGIANKLGDTIPIEDVLDVVDAKMTRFVNSKKTEVIKLPGQKLSRVDDGGSNEKVHATYNDLTHEQKNVVDNFKKTVPNFNVDDYIRELEEIGENG